MQSETLSEDAVVNFEPKLWLQRRMLVGRILKEDRVQSVLDLGCGEGSLLSFLMGDTTIQRLVGVDLLSERLCLTEDRLKPVEMDVQMPRETPLQIDLFQGSISIPDKRILHHQPPFDATICIEVIEHLFAPDLERFPVVLFGLYRPPLVILTTPNAEYNVHFTSLNYGQPNATYRDEDHKFEWTRKEFEAWCNLQAEKYGYNVQFTGVGVHNGSMYDEAIGYCTQAAVFRRKTDPIAVPEIAVESPWKFHTIIEYPHFDSSAFTAELIQLEIRSELPYLIEWVFRQDLENNHAKEFKVTLDHLFLVHRLRQVCGAGQQRMQTALELFKEDALMYDGTLKCLRVSCAWFEEHREKQNEKASLMNFDDEDDYGFRHGSSSYEDDGQDISHVEAIVQQQDEEDGTEQASLFFRDATESGW